MPVSGEEKRRALEGGGLKKIACVLKATNRKKERRDVRQKVVHHLVQT